MAAIGGHAIALGGDADDDVGVEFGHRREAIAAGSSTSKSSAMKAAPARRAASPCSHSASHAARNPSPVTASRAATSPASTSPVPAVESQEEPGGDRTARPSGAATMLSLPL